MPPTEVVTNATKPLLDKLLVFLQSSGYIKRQIAKSGEETLVTQIYGPMGSLLKHNIMQEWWKSTVTKAEENIFGVSSPIFQSRNLPPNEPQSAISGDEISCSGNVNNPGEAPHSLLSMRKSLYRSTLHHYQSILSLVGGRLPFGMAQWGVCVNPTISPDGNGETSADQIHPIIGHSAEKTDLTLQFFCSPSSATQWFHYWQRRRYLWWRKFTSVPSAFSVSELMTTSQGEQAVSIQHVVPWGSTVSVETIVNKGSHCLESYAKETNTCCMAKDGRKNVLPHLIECNTCLDVATATYLTDAYKERARHEVLKTILHLHPKLAPFKVSLILSATGVGNLAQVREMAAHLTKELRWAGVSLFYLADAGQQSLDQQFTRHDEFGIPYNLILNDNTLSTGMAGLRNRDTTLKEQVHIAEVKNLLKSYLR